jgi:capsular exopolysaccharide synthesis family protein
MPSQLPALPQQMPPALGNTLPAAPWFESNEPKGGFNFLSFLHSMRRRWLLGVGLGFIVASTIAAMLWLLMPVKYEAFVQIRVRRNQDQMLRDRNMKAQHPQDYEIEKQTQAALIRSPFVLTAALRQPGISQMRLVRDEPWFGERDNPIAWLERQLKVEYAQGSEVLRLSMHERYPDELKKLLNAVTDAYLTEIVQAEVSEKRQKFESLRNRHRVLQQKIQDQYREIGTLAQTNGSPESEAVKIQIEMGYRELSSIDREKMAADQEFFKAYDNLMLIQQRMASAAAQTPRDWELQDVFRTYPEYQMLQQNLMELQQAVKFGGAGGQGRAGMGMSQGMQAQIAQIQQEMEEFKYRHKSEAAERLKVMTNNDERLLQQEYEYLQMQVRNLMERRKALYGRHEQLSKSLQTLGAFNADLMVRQVALEGEEDNLNRISQEMETLELEMSSKPQISVIEKAIIPDESNWIMKYMQIIAAWFLSLIGTVLGITLWDMQLHRVNNTQELADSGDIRVIGTLPSLNTRRAGGLLPISNAYRRTIEVTLTRSIDSIRTSLQFARRQQPYEVIMVTSALGQEGKTTVASQLAVSYARTGRRTLLIDGDVRNPQQHVVLGLPMSKGLSDLLRSDVTLDEVVKATPAENLWVLPAGYRDGNTDQYLASPVVSRLFAELRNRFDIIIVDTGPALTSPDAMLLGQHADGAVIAIRRDISRMPKVTEAVDRLKVVGIEIAGAVLNGAGSDIRESELIAFEAAPPQQDPQLETV